MVGVAMWTPEVAADESVCGRAKDAWPRRRRSGVLRGLAGQEGKGREDSPDHVHCVPCVGCVHCACMYLRYEPSLLSP